MPIEPSRATASHSSTPRQIRRTAVMAFTGIFQGVALPGGDRIRLLETRVGDEGPTLTAAAGAEEEMLQMKLYVARLVSSPSFIGAAIVELDLGDATVDVATSKASAEIARSLGITAPSGGLTILPLERHFPEVECPLASVAILTQPIHGL